MKQTKTRKTTTAIAKTQSTKVNTAPDMDSWNPTMMPMIKVMQRMKEKTVASQRKVPENPLLSA
jgi:hypothetical protein